MFLIQKHGLGDAVNKRNDTRKCDGSSRRNYRYEKKGCFNNRRVPDKELYGLEKA
jgi:hypothetical protein